MIFPAPSPKALNVIWIIGPTTALRASIRAIRSGGVGSYLRQGLSARTCPSAVDHSFESVKQMWLTLSLKGKILALEQLTVPHGSTSPFSLSHD